MAFFSYSVGSRIFSYALIFSFCILFLESRNFLDFIELSSSISNFFHFLCYFIRFPRPFSDFFEFSYILVFYGLFRMFLDSLDSVEFSRLKFFRIPLYSFRFFGFYDILVNPLGLDCLEYPRIFSGSLTFSRICLDSLEFSPVFFDSLRLFRVFQILSNSSGFA